jgi:ethanolamine utilization cobalamin adenosyltransferase
MRLKKDNSIRSLDIPKGTIVTPSALEYLKMNSITLNFIEVDEKTMEREEEARPGAPSVYYAPDGEKLDSKPEMLTHLHGHQLTEKDNPMIVFRGKLDTLSAAILEAQVLGEEKENRAFVNDLQEILEFVRSLLPAEYKGSPLEEFHVLGLSSRELRERSHHPAKYYGRKHLLMDCAMGALSVRLNSLRTLTRETELTAVTAFRGDPSNNAGQEGSEQNSSGQSFPGQNSSEQESSWQNCRRPDIVEALNRLSSLFYILMFKYLPTNYSSSGSAGI